MGALTVDRQAAAVPQALVAADLDLAADVGLHLAAQVTFHLQVGLIDGVAQREHVLVGQVLGTQVGADAGGLQQFEGSGAPDFRDAPMAYRWRNCLIMEHPNLPGKGTSSEKSFLFHKSAIGHAMDTAGLQSPVGYDEEQDYSWARASGNFGSKLLQNQGIVQMLHDGSAYVAS